MVDIREQTFPILFAAAIYAVLGWWYLSWTHQYTSPSAGQPQLVHMVVVLKWTLRGGAIAFGVAGLLALAGKALGPLLYGVAGILVALLLATVALWDLSNAQYFSGLHPALLLLLAAWHGYSSITGLHELRTSSRRPPALTAEQSGLASDR